MNVKTIPQSYMIKDHPFLCVRYNLIYIILTVWLQINYTLNIYQMSLTDRSQIFNKWKIQADVQTISTFTSTSKRKGISLSKSLKENKEERSQSFIKLSARGKNTNFIQKRSIKLIVRHKPQIQQQRIQYKVDKQNNRNHGNKQIIFSDKDCEYEQILRNNKRAIQMQQKNLSSINTMRTKQSNLSRRQSKIQKPSSKILNLRL